MAPSTKKNLHTPSCSFVTRLSRNCRVTAEKTLLTITEKSLLKHGLKLSKRERWSWRRTLMMSNCFGSCLTLTSVTRTETVFRDRLLSSLIRCGSGGGTATQHITQTQLTHQTLTHLRNRSGSKRFQALTSPTTSQHQSRKLQTT